MCFLLELAGKDPHMRSRFGVCTLPSMNINIAVLPGGNLLSARVSKKDGESRVVYLLSFPLSADPHLFFFAQIMPKSQVTDSKSGPRCACHFHEGGFLSRRLCSKPNML